MWLNENSPKTQKEGDLTKTGNRYFVTEAEKRNQKLGNRPIAWFVWLLMAVCPPLGIYLLWHRKSAASVVVKALLTIVCIGWMGVWITLVTWLLGYATVAGTHVAYREYLHSLSEYLRSITR